jgi:MarR family transcriptional regulator for hemolysin
MAPSGRLYLPMIAYVNYGRRMASSPGGPSLGRLLIDVCRQSRRYVTVRCAESTQRPYNQLRLLQAVADDRVQSQVALAERLCLDAPAVSRLVDRLEDDGLIARKAGSDRRCVKLATLRPAETELDVLHRAQRDLDKEMERTLHPAERAELRRLLGKLDEALRSTTAARDAADGMD